MNEDERVKGRLLEAAIDAELATGREEVDRETARRHVVVRLAIIAAGFIVLLGGLAMMVLPGPGILGILAGLGILSAELPWAERLMERVKEKARLDELKKQPAWVRVAMWVGTIGAAGGSIVYLMVR